ncbi:SNF5-domain-containing protein [Auricularia subglabra TFB-10046 SS5]|uniref:SNF5-domain-containing protein n=1 Tax=Auricularia subglabra (strain TFB-10046 / SS5) TaxID=717982 RepID=J0D1Y9_AURST|nr:SNF5-domain-containing protein [Auricularia subglabra TFB-10046 SS5]
MNLKDQFEWDIVNSSNSPEHFAEVYCSDLGLGGEFKTAVAHCIREQSQVHMKSLFVVGHPMDGTPILEEEVKQTFLPPIDIAARSFEQTSTFTPIIDYLSDGEIERTEKEREKELKRKRRQTKGKRGIALPDRDPVRTHRTPAIGFPDMDPSLASSGITAPTSSKRAAAAAASATIAVMVASENEGGGGRYSAPVNLPEKAVQPPKPTRTRGLYKPPPIPNPIENPRAQMTKTENTALASTDRATRPPDSSGSTRLTAFHRPKDEFVAEGQHKNIIDGVWHCSNCGAPDGIAVGRRKGPNGIKSQCGPCGKYWHQHRKPRPVQYSTDRAWHERQLREMSKKGKRSRVLPNIHTDLPPSHNRVDDGPYQPLDVGASSPQSTMSSMSQQSVELPLAKKARINGNAPVSREAPRAASPPQLPPAPPPVPVVMPTNAAPPPPSGGDNGVQHVSAPPYPTDGSGPSLSPLARPEWLMTALKGMQDKYPDDRFDVIQRPRMQTEQTPDDEIWRVKCFDCPGKLYKPGPAQSLDNFEVHLRNRLHRQKVAARVSGAPPPSAS